MATINNPGSQSALSDYPLVFNITGTVASQPPITWGLSGSPPGVSIESTGDATARITFRRALTSMTPSVVSLTVTADEDGEDQSQVTFSVTVSPRPTSPAVLSAAGVL